MSSKKTSWARLTVRHLFAVMLVLAFFVIAIRETTDSDFWWHLRTGQVIVRQGIPHQDIFSFTVPDHAWITHEWLSEIAIWLAYEAVGLAGLMLAFAGLIALTFTLIYKRCVGRPYLAGFVVVLAALSAAPFTTVRPRVFNFLLVALFVYLLEGFRQKKLSHKALWWMVPLTLLWANLHSGYLVGVVLIVAYATGEGLQRLVRRTEQALSRQDIARLFGLAGLSFLAAAVNPNGPSLWTYPFFTLGSPTMQQFITEWYSPDFHSPKFWPFAILLATGVAALVLDRRQPSWTDLILFGGLAGAALLSRRHIPLFAIVVSPLVTRSLLSSLAGTPLFALASADSTETVRSEGGFLIRLNWLLLSLALIAAFAYVAQRTRSNQAVIGQYYPVAAVDFLEESGLADERGFNVYHWGGYLIWRGLPVYVDGRADVYGDEFLWEFQRVRSLGRDWQEPLLRYAVTYALIQNGSSLDAGFELSTEWREAYRDGLAVVYTRRELGIVE